MIFVTVSVMFRIITQLYQAIMFYFVLFICPNWLFNIVLAFVPAPPLPPPCVCVCECVFSEAQSVQQHLFVLQTACGIQR